MKNILVVKLRYIGDVLLATPVFRALRDRFPEARLTAAVHRGTEEVLQENPDIHEVLVVERSGWGEQLRFLGEIRRRRFDCVIDLTDGDRSAILAGFSGAPMRIGFNEEHRWRGLLYTHVASVRPGVVHRLEHDLEALRPLGIDPKPIPLVLSIPPEHDLNAGRLLEELGAVQDSRQLVMIQPGARYWFKAWPAQRFAELADRLTESFGCRVLVGGNRQELSLAETIASHCRSKPLILAGRAALPDYAAILKRCALFVGNDNGPMHMAAALDVPVVALFGPSNPDEWGPRGRRVRVLYKGLDCRRCFHPTCERGEQSCMRQITVEEAFAAAGSLLNPQSIDR